MTFCGRRRATLAALLVFAASAQADALRLETRLSAPTPAAVSKILRAETPEQQAENAWLHAARLLEQGRAREALPQLEAAIALDPAHLPARQALIALALEAGQTERGAALLQAGRKLHPQDPWLARALAHLAQQANDLASALAHLQPGLATADAAYWAHYAGLLNRNNQPAEAAQAYRQAARLAPDHGPWWIGLGVALEHAGDPTEAAAAYRRALQTKLSGELRAFAAGKVVP